MATYKYQILTLELLPNDTYTHVPCRTKDDLPAHVRGITKFHRLGGIGNGYYLPQHLSTNNKLEPLEFINNSWFGLVYNPSQKGYFTRSSLQIFADNKLGLRYWRITNPQHPNFKPAEMPTVSSSRYCAPTSLDSEDEQTPTNHPAESPLFELAPTFPIEPVIRITESRDNQPPEENPNNPEDPPDNLVTNNMAGNGGNGGALRGTAPSIFAGDRSRSDAFTSEFCRYRLLNRNNNAISNPFNCILTALSYIKGPLVEDWVSAQDRRLERCLDPTRDDYVPDTSEILWLEFEATFKSAWKDSERTQSVYEQLMKLTMKDLDVDSYIATFERLATAAKWDVSAEGTIDRFTRGLRDNIHHRVINRDKEPVMWEDWKDAARAEVHKVRKTISAGLDFGNWNQNKPRDAGLFQTSQTYRTPQTRPPTNNSGIVPMEVDSSTTQTREPFKRLTDDERDQLRKEGKCFRCRQKGHMAHECLGRPLLTPHTPTNVSARTTTTTDDTTAVEVTPDDSVSNAPTARAVAVASKLTKAQQILAIEESMDEEERGAYLDACNMGEDFYSVGP